MNYKFILKPIEMAHHPISFQLINNNETNSVVYFYPSLNDLMAPKPHSPKFFK